MEWTPSPGHHDAKRFIQEYPDPRAFRAALGTSAMASVAAFVPSSLHDLRVAIGDGSSYSLYEYAVQITPEYFGSSYTSVVYSVIRSAAQDRQIWVSPDATITMN